MNDVIRQMRAIAGTAFQEAFRRRLLYIMIFLLLFALIAIGSSGALFRMAQEAGEFETVDYLRRVFAIQILNTWNLATLILALFLGATALSSEITGRTLVNVFSRPVSRATYLIGRFIGATFFLWLFLGIGVFFALAVGWFFGTAFPAIFWLGVLSMLIRVTLVYAVSMALSTFLPPVLAGSALVFFWVAPALFRRAFDSSNAALRAVSDAVYYLSPARMPVDLLGEAYLQNRTFPMAPILAVLSENALYVVAMIVLGCIIFARRPIAYR